MTFFMPPSSGLCVKILFEMQGLSASPSAPCCFSKMLAWNAYNSSALTLRWCCMWQTESTPNSRSPHWQERLSCAKEKKKKGGSKEGISLSVYYLSEKRRMVRKRNFSQADENLPWSSFGGATAAGNPIVQCFWSCLLQKQICFLKRANVTQPFKPCEAFVVHTLPDNSWLFCVT